MGKAEGVKLKGKSSFFRKKSGESWEDVGENSSYYKKNFEDSYQLVKHFPDFTIW